MDFVAIDFETANYSQSPCSLGLTIVESQKVVGCESYLINPKEPFSETCIRVNGITPAIVKNSPEFPEIWERTEPLFLKYPIVAHNISFDYDVLCRSLKKYNLAVPDLRLYCTMQLARKNFPDIGKYSLSVLCEHFGVSLEHHHSCDDDSTACASLLIKMLQKPNFRIFEYTPHSNSGTYSAGFKAPDYEESSVQYDDMLLVSFDQKTFVITGDVDGFSRDDLTGMIQQRGGICKNSVSRKVDYLIVGMQNKSVIKDKAEIKSEKILKAEKLRDEGYPIKIISDEDFLTILHQEKNSDTTSQGWFSFCDESDKVRKLKSVGIIAPTAFEVKQIFYCGIYSNQNLVKCDVIGYVDSSVLVISLFDRPHKIHADYLKEMQPTKKEAAKVND